MLGWAAQVKQLPWLTVTRVPTSIAIRDGPDWAKPESVANLAQKCCDVWGRVQPCKLSKDNSDKQTIVAVKG